jgi:hypothetical protein
MRVVGNEHYYAGEGPVLRPREREKVAKPDEGRWDETINCGEVSDPCEAPFNCAPFQLEKMSEPSKTVFDIEAIELNKGVAAVPSPIGWERVRVRAATQLHAISGGRRTKSFEYALRGGSSWVTDSRSNPFIEIGGSVQIRHLGRWRSFFCPNLTGIRYYLFEALDPAFWHRRLALHWCKRELKFFGRR